MNHAEAKRCSQRHFLVAAGLFLVVAVGHSSSVMASCGDYLLHAGPMVAESAGEGSMFPVSPTHLPTRRSPCENGNCQQSPMTTTPLEVPRTTAPQQPAIVGGPQDDLMDHSDFRWQRPTVGLSVDSPFLEVASPPPRHS